MLIIYYNNKNVSYCKCSRGDCLYFPISVIGFLSKSFLLGKFNVCVWSMLLELSVSKWKGKY